jgi:hypothetical protein
MRERDKAARKAKREAVKAAREAEAAAAAGGRGGDEAAGCKIVEEVKSEPIQRAGTNDFEDDIELSDGTDSVGEWSLGCDSLDSFGAVLDFGDSDAF